MAETEAQKRVQKGIELLDAKGPKDWRERVNLETFNWSSRDCVLGQVFGQMWHEEAQALCDHRMEPYGFNGDNGAQLTELTDAWREALS